MAELCRYISAVNIDKRCIKTVYVNIQQIKV